MSRYAASLVLCAVCARGQAGRAEIFGTVRDPSGLPIAGAVVRAAAEQTGVVYSEVASSSGEYHFLALPSGMYDLTAEHAGFSPQRRPGIEVRVADRIALDFDLNVGTASEAVEVTAGAPMLETESGTFSFVVDETKISTLPLDGRNFVPLIALAPGVALPPGSTASPSLLPRINGSRPRTSEYIYDGISVLQPEPGQVAYYPVLDAIDDFRVQINSYSAEYGRSNGGIIQVNGKSGTNEFHGDLFEYLRNEVLNARNYFAPPGANPPFKRNQYGAVLGGPIQHNKTFFLVDWQGTRLRIGNTRVSTVPTTAQRAGVFSTPVYDPATTHKDASGAWVRDPFLNNTIPSNRFDTAAASILSRYPLPNVFVNGKEAIANNYRRVAIDSTDQDQAETRLDRYFGDRHRVFARYTYLHDNSSPGTPLPDGSGALTSGVIGATETRAHALASEYDYELSARSMNQARFGYTRRGFNRSSLVGSQPASDITGIPNIPATAFANSYPIFQIAGYQQIGPTESANSQFTTSVTQFLDTFSTVKGHHSIKMGADMRLERLHVLQPPDPTGLFSFSSVFTSGLTKSGTPAGKTGDSVASFLLGQVNSFNIDAQQNFIRPRAKIAEFFVQDDWKATSRLSLGLGLRYTVNFPSTEANDQGAVFNLATQKLDFLGKDGFARSARKLDWTDFGPRVSLAFRVTDSFAIRSGYGLVWIEQAGITTPFTIPYFPFIQSVSQRSVDNIHAAFLLSQGPAVQIVAPNPNSGLGQGVFSVDRNTGSGYAQQWNFTLQRTFGTTWSAEMGYLGSKLTRLGVPDTNLNQLPAADLVLGSQLTKQVPNPFYGQVPASSSIGGPTIAEQQLLRPYPEMTTVTLFRNNIGNSTFHAFQAHLERRFSSGLTLTAAYTFSKLIDDASSVFDASILTGPIANFPVADSYNRRLEKDVSTGDIPHIFSAAFVYDLPFGKGHRFLRGWEIAGVVRIQSGMPLAVTQVTNFNSFAGFGTQRPNRIADPELDPSLRSATHWFNTDAFTIAPQFTIGNSSRNPVRGPGYQTADMMLGKTFPITERAKFEFRAEAFNVSNTPPLGQPNGVAGSPAFGTIASAFDSRVFELAARVNF